MIFLKERTHFIENEYEQLSLLMLDEHWIVKMIETIHEGADWFTSSRPSKIEDGTEKHFEVLENKDGKAHKLYYVLKYKIESQSFKEKEIVSQIYLKE